MPRLRARDWSDVTSFGTVPLANAYRDPAAKEEDEPSYPLEVAAEGRAIAGYGAPAKAGTLLNACGIGAREIAYRTDTTSLKQHKLLPGSHIPILPPNDGGRPDPDYYLLFAWNYAQEILDKEQRYLRDGGRFIVSVPEPSIVTSQPIGDRCESSGLRGRNSHSSTYWPCVTAR